MENVRRHHLAAELRQCTVRLRICSSSNSPPQPPQSVEILRNEPEAPRTSGCQVYGLLLLRGSDSSTSGIIVCPASKGTYCDVTIDLAFSSLKKHRCKARWGLTPITTTRIWRIIEAFHTRINHLEIYGLEIDYRKRSCLASWEHVEKHYATHGLRYIR